MLAKITDFGISKDLEATLKECNTFVGTYSYMSPERMENKNYSFESDIWSIGVVVYEMASGVPAYALSNLYELY